MNGALGIRQISTLWCETTTGSFLLQEFHLQVRKNIEIGSSMNRSDFAFVRDTDDDA